MPSLGLRPNVLPIPGCFIAATVTLNGGSIVVEPENIHKAIAALVGPPQPGAKVKVSIEFETMTDAAFNALVEHY